MSGRGRKEDREALRAAVFRAGPAFASTLESLRETCRDALARGPSDDELLDLLTLHLASPPSSSPVAREMDRALGRLGSEFATEDAESTEKKGNPAAASVLSVVKEHPRRSLCSSEGSEVVHLTLRFVESLSGKRLDEAAVLDPCAGTGDFLARLPGRAYGLEPSLPAYYAASAAAPNALLGFADPLALKVETPRLDLFESENAARVREIGEAGIAAVVARPPAQKAARLFRWSVERLRGRGVVAFVTDAPLGLEDETRRVFELDLRDEYGVVATFLVLEPGGFRRCRLAPGEPLPQTPGDLEWEEPAGDPPVWDEALPVEGGVFLQAVEGVTSGRDAWAWDADRDALLAKVSRTEAFYHSESTRLAGYAGRNAVRHDEGEIRWTPILEAKLRRRQKIVGKPVRGLRRPFAKAWLMLDPVLLDRPGPWPRLRPGPCLLVSPAPFSLLVTDVVPDGKALGTGTRCFPLGEGVSPAALDRFRAAYGAGVTERNLFDYVVALLHHPAYRARYADAIRRSGPRVPLLLPEALAPLRERADAPPVGVGTAYGTGWLRAEDFEPSSLPDYDDPFASPYARDDADPGFLLLAGLGAALAFLQTDFDTIRPYDLEPVVAEGPSRLLRRQGRVVLGAGSALENIPEAAFAYEVGGKSPVAWSVERLRTGGTVDAKRIVGQAVAVGWETARLMEILSDVSL